MRSLLHDARCWLPSPSLMLHYCLIAVLCGLLGIGAVYHSRIQTVLTSVDSSSKQIAGLADRIKGDIPDDASTESKLARIQVKAYQIQTAVQPQVTTTVN